MVLVVVVILVVMVLVVPVCHTKTNSITKQEMTGSFLKYPVPEGLFEWMMMMI